MIGLKKFLIGSSIMAFLLVITLYYINRQHKDDIIKSEKKTTNNATITQENEAVNLQEDNGVTEDLNSIEANKTDETNTLNTPLVEINKDIETKVEELVNKYYDVTSELDTDILSSNLQDVVEQKIEIFTKKKEIIETYENIINYIKPGLMDNTYIVFTTYDIKLKNIETLVPGMSVLSVIKDKAGKLLIDIDPNQEDFNDYIKILAKEKDMNNIINDVNIRLSGAIKKDASLKKFIDYLKEIT